MTDLPIVIREDAVRHGGAPRQRVQASFVPSGEGSDLRARYDLWVARRAYALLDRAYPGHGWQVIADSAQGYVGIRLPVLTGGNWAYLIRWGDLAPARVVMAGGELLERYRLPRGRFELGTFLEAREKHSILLDRARKIPS
jgi:hypothetical protein